MPDNQGISDLIFFSQQNPPFQAAGELGESISLSIGCCLPYHRVIAREKRKNSRRCQKKPLLLTLPTPLSFVWWLFSVLFELAPSIPTSFTSILLSSHFLLFFTSSPDSNQSTRPLHIINNHRQTQHGCPREAVPQDWCHRRR